MPLQLDRTKGGARELKPLNGPVPQRTRGQSARRQRLMDAALDQGEIGKARSFWRQRLKVQISIPDFTQRREQGARCARQGQHRLKFSVASGGHGLLDGRLQLMQRGRSGESSGETRGNLRQRHQLQPSRAGAGSREAPHPEGQRAVNDQSGAAHLRSSWHIVRRLRFSGSRGCWPPPFQTPEASHSSKYQSQR